MRSMDSLSPPVKLTTVNLSPVSPTTCLIGKPCFIEN